MPPEIIQPDDAGADTDVRHQAALWLIELRAEGDDPDLRGRWQHWHDAAPEHRQAWAQIEAFGTGLRQVPPLLARATLAPQAPRRRALKTLGLVLAAGSTAWFAGGSRQLPILLASHRTGPGERRALTLADGSELHLNAGSALDVHLDGAFRRLVLHVGEIHITTAPDPASRPFFVDTPQGRAQALGTRFTVRVDAAGSQVAVYSGAVAIHPRLAGDAAPLVLGAGQQARFSDTTAGSPATAGETDTAWRRGMLVADETPLPAFIAELGRLTGRSLSCAPSLAGLKVTGTYPLADPDAVLELLTRALPIRVERQRSWWTGTRYAIKPA